MESYQDSRPYLIAVLIAYLVGCVLTYFISASTGSAHSIRNAVIFAAGLPLVFDVIPLLWALLFVPVIKLMASKYNENT